MFTPLDQQFSIQRWFRRRIFAQSVVSMNRRPFLAGMQLTAKLCLRQAGTYECQHRSVWDAWLARDPLQPVSPAFSKYVFVNTSKVMAGRP